jgi:hypothetical protein
MLSSAVLQVLFLSETRLVAGGFDCNPMLFEIDQNGVWYTTTFSMLKHVFQFLNILFML